MFKVFIKTHFSSAHYLRNYPGNCEHLHGHNWDVVISVRARKLNDIDVAMDFRDLKNIASRIMKELDHKNLNEMGHFKDHNPSSERLAEYIFNRLNEELEDFEGVEADSVEVRETPSSGVIFYVEEK